MHNASEKSGGRWLEAKSGHGRTRPIYLLVAFLLVTYVTWRLFPSLPFGHSLAAKWIGTPLGLLAILAAARTSWRSADDPAVRRAWLWIALGLTGTATGEPFELLSEAAGTELPSASPAAKKCLPATNSPGSTSVVWN